MKDYYEILEVNKKASKEVIDKAYKVLAKKYHPDLQQEGQKKVAQKKMQEVNEAYEVLSDEAKRKEYDDSLEIEERKKIEELIKKENSQRENNQQYTANQQQYEEEQQGQYQDNYEQEYVSPFSKKAIKEQQKREKQRRRELIEEEERQYRNYLRSLGYKVREKWTWKRFLRLLKALAILAVAILILWIIPPTRKLMIETYEENPIIQTIINVIANIFVGIFKGIGVFFKQIFNIKS